MLRRVSPNSRRGFSTRAIHSGYDPAELQTAYGLTPLYNRGLTGAGQTIVIVDAFGSNTIVQDANIFSELNGLPPLTASNFQIIDSAGPGTATCTFRISSRSYGRDATIIGPYPSPTDPPHAISA